jgi:hypothetical protein
VANYRQIGGRLGAFIRTNNPTTQQIQALLSDLLADDELLLPMRDLVARKCFSALREFAGSGRGILQRDTCLQEISKIYLPSITTRIAQLINGIVDLPEKQSTSAPQDQKEERIPSNLMPHKGKESAGSQPTTDFIGSKEYSSRPRSNNILAGILAITISFTLIPTWWVAISQSTDRRSAEIPSFNHKTTQHCDKILEQLRTKAKLLPPYETADGKVYFLTSDGRTLSPWAAGTQTWQSVYSALTLWPPKDYTEDTNRFLSLREEYNAKCE